MDNDSKFKMSQLLDGELSTQDTIALWECINSEPALAGKWKRYNQIRSVMNSQPPVVASDGFVDAVHKALESEPTLFVPGAQHNSAKGKNVKRTFLRRSSMIAATGVLAMMVYGYQQFAQHVGPVPGQTLPTADSMADNMVAESQPAELPSQPVVIHTQPVRAAASNVYSQPQIPSEQAFNEYLVSHGEYEYSNSIKQQPLIPAVRVVSLNSEN
ncbi:MAG: sigma-E factor negative regulatory protein [Gammaproteobacteria bacterium]|nr:sigma-E factor negative regulatory protein [Gammaproteobacteria bacterium]